MPILPANGITSEVCRILLDYKELEGYYNSSASRAAQRELRGFQTECVILAQQQIRILSYQGVVHSEYLARFFSHFVSAAKKGKVLSFANRCQNGVRSP